MLKIKIKIYSIKKETSYKSKVLIANGFKIHYAIQLHDFVDNSCLII